MSQRPFHFRLFFMFMLLAVVGSATASAGDFYRHLGIGYSAGYHAPAPFVQESSFARHHGWWHWKSACCQPGAAPAACGCQCEAPCAEPCAPRYSAWLPRCGACETAAPCGTCGTRNPGVY